jgi:hypothetical protein
MRGLLLLVALAACAGRPTTGPAWPKASAADRDGGESLAPRVVRAVVEVADTPEEEHRPAPAPVIAPAPTAPPASGGSPPASAPAAAPAEETFTGEEIIIEVDD